MDVVPDGGAMALIYWSGSFVLNCLLVPVFVFLCLQSAIFVFSAVQVVG